MAEAPAYEPHLLRRTQSTGDIPVRELPQPARARISASHRRSEHGGPLFDSTPFTRAVVPENSSTDEVRPPWGFPLTGSPPTPALQQVGQHTPPRSRRRRRRRNRSWFARAKIFFGIGPDATRTRKALVSVTWTIFYGFLQIIAIIVVLSFAAHIKSPTDSNIVQIKSCGRPLVAWNCIWIARVCLSTALAYWNFIRIRKADNTRREDVESGALTGSSSSPTSPQSEPSRRRQRDRSRRSRSGTAGSNLTSTDSSEPSEPAVPYNHVYARLSLLSSMLTLTWFLTAHILEYTTINTCRVSSPLVWWLTFAVLCTMYFLVLEVILFGFLVFMILPFIMLFYSIVLLCLGRHPLQNPHYIKPEIGKLPKSIVDRIPLVIYIPPPPDNDPNSHPISIPKPIHSYPPKPPPPKTPKKRFAFLRKKSKNRNTESAGDGGKRKTTKGMEDAANDPETWEDLWEQGEYPFVRLEGNRAACAVCLMDFEEPKRVGGGPTKTDDGEKLKEEKDNAAEVDSIPTPTPETAVGEEEVQIPVEHITEEEREGLPRLEDAGEGPQPLRLLACGHVFHKTCIDPWLTDVSGRCPVCQRPVEMDDTEDRKRSRRRRRS
ncbi:hypothetical protein BV22DRAFT_1033448 [Leucogyrophana mollusca]|uniref:Uncharacterized protein n=1 Tax=Leucogyrophana mollusca TaxID=85980 RepID=A0ACB8BJB8_9AGAM|nr:hypothetical protein BV22DRAFT_1033448 [Leucogyrophana mollusca]